MNFNGYMDYILRQGKKDVKDADRWKDDCFLLCGE